MGRNKTSLLLVMTILMLHKSVKLDVINMRSCVAPTLNALSTSGILTTYEAMFTLYRIDFRSGSEIDPIQCEQCLEKSNRTGPVWS